MRRLWPVRPMLTAVLLLIWGAPAFPVGTLIGEDGPRDVEPHEARKFAGQVVRVTFEVRASKDAAHRMTVFLDSEKYFQDEKNLGIAINQHGIDDLRRSRNIAAPADYYLGKRIRVVGKVVLRDERVYIDVDKASQLEEVKEDEPAE